MNTEHRYKLASNKVPKLNCPYCGAKKHWQRYIDIETGEVLPEQHGRCDNADKCGQWVTPKDTGYAKAIWEQEQYNLSVLPYRRKLIRNKTETKPVPETVFFDFETFRNTLNTAGYDKNIFLQNLLTILQSNGCNHLIKSCNHLIKNCHQMVEKVVSLYRLGTISSGYKAGAVTFPFLDINHNIRAIQVKQFDKNNHSIGNPIPLNRIIENNYKRNKMPVPEWIEAYNKNKSVFSCLFGEHLLSKYPCHTVGLVEAPKTAVYSTLYFGLPETKDGIIWLAVGAKGWLNFEKIKVLKGRFVFVFPDLSNDGNTFKSWETKLNDFEKKLPGTRFIFSDLLEKNATEEQKKRGLDLADFMDWRKYSAKILEIVLCI